MPTPLRPMQRSPLLYVRDLGGQAGGAPPVLPAAKTPNREIEEQTAQQKSDPGQHPSQTILTSFRISPWISWFHIQHPVRNRPMQRNHRKVQVK